MKKKKPRLTKPVITWQTGAYQPKQTIRLELPLQLLMICKLANVTPEQLLKDFIENMSFGSWKREGREKARNLLADYFIEHGYGKDLFSSEELKSMFAELDAVAMLFPRHAPPDLLDAYSYWRGCHQEHWFRKWLRK